MAYRTDEPKNSPGETLGRYSREKDPPNASSHAQCDDDFDTGNTVQNP